MQAPVAGVSALKAIDPFAQLGRWRQAGLAE